MNDLQGNRSDLLRICATIIEHMVEPLDENGRRRRHDQRHIGEEEAEELVEAEPDESTRDGSFGGTQHSLVVELDLGAQRMVVSRVLARVVPLEHLRDGRLKLRDGRVQTRGDLRHSFVFRIKSAFGLYLLAEVESNRNRHLTGVRLILHGPK